MKNLPYRRKRESRTNYKKRLALLKSNKARFVVRKSNKYLTLQLIKYDDQGDKVLDAITTKKLVEKGLKSGNNIPAAYLAGFTLAKQTKVKEAILDLGLHYNQPRGKIYAAVKGLLDGGVNIPVSEEMFPSQERLDGKHLDVKAQSSITKIKSSLK